MNRFDLSGKIAVVNGASRGIGEAIAKGLAECGALVVLTSRSQEGVQKVADEIVESGGEAVARACHAGRLDDHPVDGLERLSLEECVEHAHQIAAH